MNKNYGEDLMASPHPPPWLLKILQIENIVWNELPEELQLTLPYCPIEVAQEVIRLYKLKMEEIENSVTSSHSALKIAILAAMNITDELFSARRETEDGLKDICRRSEILIKEIDRVIEEK